MKYISQKEENQKVNKNKEVNIYIFCKNKQIKEYYVNASRKFNIEDETYVIKEKCCYLRKFEDIFKLVSFYVEGNPNPFDLRAVEKNKGLDKYELDKYIAGDIFNILIECQDEDRRPHVLHLTSFVFVLSLISFILIFFGW